MNPSPTPQALLQQVAQIQRMEPGKLCVMRHGPHGPYYNLQCRENGRTFTRYVPAEQAELVATHTANYQRFQALVEQYAQQVIERTRADRAADVKKKDPPRDLLLAQEQEIQQLMTQFEALPPTGVDVQKLEVLVRTAIFKPANAVVGYLLQSTADRIDAGYQPRPGQVRKGRETIRVHCLFGAFDLTRDYYYQAGKQQGHYPADAALGLEVSYTPALARLIALAGADAASYQQAETHLAETGGIAVSARQIQRLVQRVGQSAQRWQAREVQPQECEPCDAPVLYVSADGTGAPMRAAELVGRAGKQADGTAKTRQVYLGCVFTQHRTDAKGRPVRDWESTTYVSSMDPIAAFGPLVRREALRRGMGTAQRVVLLIDGAEGLENMGKLCFRDCLQIVDFYHALEHAGRVLEALLGSKQHPAYKKRQHRWAKRLLKNRVETLIAQTRREAAATGRSETVEQELGYFVRNSARMQYGSFRQQGLFIGSGVIEAGCKTIIGSRCKQSGMFWSRTGAENILAFRCIHASRRRDNFWKHRLGQHAARNDALPLAA